MSSVFETSVYEAKRRFPLSAAQPNFGSAFLAGIKRRLAREQRRRKVGRAYDMALEIARIIPERSEVLDVGCGNGYIAHHLSAILGRAVVGIDVVETTDAPIQYRRYAVEVPARSNSFDAVLLNYVLHHAQDIETLLKEVRRVLRGNGVVIVYEDLPQTWWDKFVCGIHSRQWKDRTGPCTFRTEVEWRELFQSFGFEVENGRALSRFRNFVHPVSRWRFTLKRR